VYDACVVVRDQQRAARGLVLLDARVSPAEFREPTLRLRAPGKKRALEDVMSKTRRQLHAGSTDAWDRFPDAWMRIAFLQAILDFVDVPIWHLNLYFVAGGHGSPLDGVAPLSEDEWFPTIDRIRQDFRLDDNDIGQRIRREFVLEPLTLPTARENWDASEAVTVEMPLGGVLSGSAVDPETTLRMTGSPIAKGGVFVGKANDKDRYVVPRPGEGWADVREDHQRASALLPTQRQAIARAKEITGNLGGGEVRIQDRHGRFSDGERAPKR
jgi:Uncharacterized protein conserved in bacteria (DUF2188)